MANAPFTLFGLPTELFDMVIEQMDHASFINFAMASFYQLSRGDARFVPQLRRIHVRSLREADAAFVRAMPAARPPTQQLQHIPASILPSQHSHRFWQSPSLRVPQPLAGAQLPSQQSHAQAGLLLGRLHRLPPEIYDMIFGYLSHKDSIRLAIADWYWLCWIGIVQPIQHDWIWHGLILAASFT